MQQEPDGRALGVQHGGERKELTAETPEPQLDPAQALLSARRELQRRCIAAHPRVRPIYRLMVRFSELANARARPSDCAELLASLRIIYRAAALIERRVSR